MAIAVLTFHFRLSGCTSLKEKRSQIKPVLARLHREYNVATAEMDMHDLWNDSLVACITLSNDPTQNQRLLQQVIAFTERTWPNLEILDHRIEMI